MTLRHQRVPSALLLAGLALFAGCDTSSGGNAGAAGVDTGGGSVGGSDVGGFQLSSINVTDGDDWQINRPIVFVFTRAVNFSTVNLNTISIRDQDDVPANGVFTFDPAQPRVVVFQPTCPVQSDFTDAGFLPGGRKYTIIVLGQDGGLGIALTSTDGKALKISQKRSFFTPSSSELSTLFQDAVPGPPLPVIRTMGATSLGATFIEVGKDISVARRIYFERNPTTQLISQPGTGDGSIPTGHPLESLETGMPLNLFSNTSSQLSFLVEMNQPVNPSPDNINSRRVRLEAEQTLMAGDFQQLPAIVTLVQNCTQTGATLRVTPQGVLPQDVRLRLVIASVFEDLSGEQHLAPIDNFAFIQTRNAGAALADEVFEGFETSVFEDRTAAFAEPRAIWGPTRLSPRFDFEGTGGPSNAFDFIVRTGGGPTVIDSDFSIVSDASQSLSQTIVNGRMDVRNFTVENGAVLQLRGGKPMVINATGTVQIDGEIELKGFTAKDVAGVFTATFPEPGAAGNLGGGKGGDASMNTTMSTPSGQTGNGPFAVPNLGGQGGETGFGSGPGNPQNADPDRRKGGGGGGGVLGADQDYTGLMAAMIPANLDGTVAEQGGRGHNKATGAVGGGLPQGGMPGTSPFRDDDPDNDFFGNFFDTTNNRIITGELPRLWAGGGGGGGGDSTRSKVFPHPSFSANTEDKGGAGGGGSGGLHIRALGDVRFGTNGRITAEGGSGARGQLIVFNSNFFVRSGAGGGGGSGGHVVIETAQTIDLGSATDVISARGGLGGPGDDPAMSGNSSAARGGNGGPGLVQLHTPNGMADITSTQPLTRAVVPSPKILIPNFGAISRARSTWIPLGGAVGTAPDDVMFLFGGTDATGDIMTTAGLVDDLTEIIGPASLTAAGTPRILNDHALVFDFANDAATMFAMNDLIYRDNPVLMRDFLLILRDSAAPTTRRRYDVATASVDPMNPDLMVLTTPTTGLGFFEFTGTMNSQIPDPTNVEFLLVPRFFKVTTSGVANSLPDSASINIKFSGTTADFDGNPVTSSILVPSTADIADLFDAGLMEPIRFFRVEVEFDLDALSNGLSATGARPALDFLRIPFRF